MEASSLECLKVISCSSFDDKKFSIIFDKKKALKSVKGQNNFLDEFFDGYIQASTNVR